MANALKSTIFILKSIDIKYIEKKYGIHQISNINTSTSSINITKISDLASTHVPETYSFLDDAKKLHKCNISMIDFKSTNEFDKSSSYHCFWDRHLIPSHISPIGCPIKYIHSQASKSYFSEISKDNYTIKENITSSKNVDLSIVDIIDKNYYITDGIFCSFNCCMAFLLDNKSSSFYNQSEMLLFKLYHDIFSNYPSLIESAPHWRNLLEYGGYLTIDTFRNNFNKVEYINHGVILNTPKLQSAGILFEEKLKF